jgi:SnoaL-like domain
LGALEPLTTNCPETDVQLLPVRDAKARGGNAVTTALGIVIFGMIALTVLPAEQRSARTPAQAALAPQDYIEIQQLVRKYAWALDGGDNYGYAYADLFTPDGVFVGMNQGPDGRSYQGRDVLAALARTPAGGPTNQRHFMMNHVITPTPDGATGRAYVVMLDIGIVGKPNAVNHGGHYDDVYEKTNVGWRFKKRTYWESKVDTWPK